MKALLVYNGGLGKNYILYDVVRDLIERTREFSIDLIPKSNEELPVLESSLGKGVLNLDFDPTLVLFLDKDLDLAKVLENKGYAFFNPSQAIGLCSDRKRTYQVLRGPPMSKAIFSPLLYHAKENRDYCRELWPRLKASLILKTTQGSFGGQAKQIKNLEDLIRETRVMSPTSYLVQECTQESLGRDIRMVLVGDQILGVMEGTNQKDFRSNIYFGGQGKEIQLTADQEVLALEAHRRLRLNLSGIDLLISSQGSLVYEVNSNLSYLGFQKATPIPVGEFTLEEILNQL